MIISDFETLSRLVDEINKSAEDSAILVEGKKDKFALQKLGVEGDFYIIKQTHTSLEETAERIYEKYRKIIFMFDRDPAGRKLLKRMKQIFSKLGVKTNTSFMLRLLTLYDSAVIEGCEA